MIHKCRTKDCEREATHKVRFSSWDKPRRYCRACAKKKFNSNRQWMAVIINPPKKKRGPNPTPPERVRA